jgi:hypothetical protein
LPLLLWRLSGCVLLLLLLLLLLWALCGCVLLLLLLKAGAAGPLSPYPASAPEQACCLEDRPLQ